MKYEDLKCEFCDGKGETEKFVEPYGDSPVTCTFCNGTGIDQEQLKVVKVERSEEVKKELSEWEWSNDYTFLTDAKEYMYELGHNTSLEEIDDLINYIKANGYSCRLSPKEEEPNREKE